MGLRQLTITEAAASTNIWFKVETEEQQRMFQEEFFKQGGKLASSYNDLYCRKVVALTIQENPDRRLDTVVNSQYAPASTEQVLILWQEEPSIVIDSLAPEVTLMATLDTSLNWQDTLTLLTQLKVEELAKDFISDKCLRQMEDEKLASLARFLLERRSLCCRTQEVINQEDVVKAFVLTTKSYLAKRTKQLEYWYKFYRKEVENIVRQSQAGLYQEELKNNPTWEGLSWERMGEE